MEPAVSPSQINNLDLYLYDVTTQSLLSTSVSTVDNVQQLYVGGLNPGDVYDMQVRKLGGHGSSVNQETYAFAYDIAPTAGDLLLGDANGDGIVNGGDLNTVLSNYNQTGMDWVHGDFSGDGTVNGGDLNTVLSNYNQLCVGHGRRARACRPDAVGLRRDVPLAASAGVPDAR